MSKIDNLFNLLEERGISRKELAEAVGVSQGNVGDWKTGRAKPSFDVLIRISEFLDVSTDYLLGTSSNPLLTFKQIKTLTGSNYARFIYSRTESSKTLKFEQYCGLCKFLNCTWQYLLGTKKEYVRGVDDETMEKAAHLDDWEALFLCTDILTRCAKGDDFKAIQIKISRIILHNLGVALNLDKEELKVKLKKQGLVKEHMDFLFDETKSEQKRWGLGLDYSSVLGFVEEFREEFGVDIMVLLTGKVD